MKNAAPFEAAFPIYLETTPNSALAAHHGHVVHAHAFFAELLLALGNFFGIHRFPEQPMRKLNAYGATTHVSLVGDFLYLLYNHLEMKAQTTVSAQNASEKEKDYSRIGGIIFQQSKAIVAR